MVKKKKNKNETILRTYKTVSRKLSTIHEKHTARKKISSQLTCQYLRCVAFVEFSPHMEGEKQEKWKHVSYGRARATIEATFVHLPDWKVDPTIRGWNDRMGRGCVREAVKTAAACEEILGSRLKSIALSRPVFVRGKGAADRHARGFTRGGVAVRL